MKKTPDLYDAHPTPAGFASAYFANLAQVLTSVDATAVGDVINDIVAARAERRSVFVIGNGGSASTASHMVNDLTADVTRKAALDIPFRIHALTDNPAVLTAIGNDTGYDNLFVNQLATWFEPGDRLLAISASGNSPNLVRAAEWVRARSGRVLSFVGFDGGALKRLSDICVHVATPPGEYGIVEDVHLALNHVISNYLVAALRSPAQMAGRSA